MAHSRESDFREWAKPPSATEEQRCQNAEAVVRNAVAAYRGFQSRKVEVFAQGSYRSGTNVRADSDVDVCVRCADTCFLALPPGMSKATFGLGEATYSYPAFRDDVGAALKGYLGAAAVTRGKKAFDLHANGYRVDADVVATFEHRRYTVVGGRASYISGTEFQSDDGSRIVNWPHQNHENGTAKNLATGTRFKKLVRVLKRLRNEMAGAGMATAASIPSYLIECLAWNAPNSAFVDEDYAVNLKAVLLHLYSGTKSDETCSDWGEVNELKYLFRGGQPWTRDAVHEFTIAAYGQAGF